jgi:hypothetical protein
MAKRIKHYHKKVRRRDIDGTTARRITVEEHPDSFYLVITEVGPTRDKDGYTTGYDLHSVVWNRYVTLKESIGAAEIAFDSSLRLGFYEAVAETTTEG